MKGMDLNELPEDEEFMDSRAQAPARRESTLEVRNRERKERMELLKLKREMDAREAESKAQKKMKIDALRGVPQPVAVPSPAPPPVPRPAAGSGPIPEGWLDCPDFGKPVAGIIPTKTPLGKSFDDLIAPGKKFTPSMFLEKQKKLSQAVGMVIDLTNTNRYYDRTEWLTHKVLHVKVPCRGRDEVPDNKTVNDFIFEALRFFGTQAKDKKYLVVHCTHGHNRTGLMIVHYLIRTQGGTVEKAVAEFAKARPPGIYKPEYLDSLFEFYHERKPERFLCPPVPEWKQDDLTGEGTEGWEDDDNGKPMLAASKQEEEEAGEGVKGDVRMTIDDVLGDEIPDAHQLEMRKMVYWYLGVQPNLNGRLTFPGSQPVSLDLKNIGLLRKKLYKVTWKADGTRYMMLIQKDGVYLIDRNFSFRRVQMRFPVKNSAPFGETQHGTLLDGEMVIDTIPQTKVQERRYLVYDLMALNGTSLKNMPFQTRWELISKELIHPRKVEEPSIMRKYDYKAEPFRVRRKDFWDLKAAGKLIHDTIPNQISHETDGLIFQAMDDPYVTRTHEGLMKWKYAHMNSVDFLLKMPPDKGPQLWLMEPGNRQKLLPSGKLIVPEGQEVEPLVGKIIECFWNKTKESWEFMRVRTDKNSPNAWHVYEKVVQSIRDNITEEVLLNEIGDILQHPPYRVFIAPPPANHPQHRHPQ